MNPTAENGTLTIPAAAEAAKPQTLPATTNGATAPAAQPQQQVIPADPLFSVASAAQQEARDQMIVMRSKLDYAQRLARMFALSGCFADVKDTKEEVAIAKALVKIKLGESMGFSEAEAMTGIDIIQGRVAVGASLRAARMQRAGFSWPQMVVSNKGCWIPLCFKGEPMMCPRVDEAGEVVLDENGMPKMGQVIVSFTEKDAQSAGLLSKDNYKKDPSSMYFARAITRAQRRYGPGVLGIDVLDTYEAKDMPAEAAAPTLSLDAFRPSTDPNRGHDGVMPTQPAGPEPSIPEHVGEQPDGTLFAPKGK